jgi:hypothetical protein
MEKELDWHRKQKNPAEGIKIDRKIRRPYTIENI